MRRIAGEFGLAVAAKPDSQDICFVPDGDYARIVKSLRPEGGRPGRIVHAETGDVLGDHAGVVHFTVGQRRGLALSERAGTDNEPLYVLRLDAGQRRVVVGPRSALARAEIVVDDVNWLGEAPPPADGQAVMARLRLPRLRSRPSSMSS